MSDSRILAAAVVASACTAPLVYLLSNSSDGKAVQNKSELEALNKKAVDLKGELDMAHFKLEAAEMEIAKLKIESSSLADKLKAETQKLDFKEASINNLQQEIVEYSLQEKSSEVKVADLEKAYSELQSQLKKQVDDLAQVAKENGKLKETLANLHHFHETQKAASHAENTSLRTKVDEMNANDKKVQSALTEANAIIQQLKANQDLSEQEYKSKLSSFEKAASKGASDVQVLESKVSELTTECQSLAENSAEKDKELEGIKKTISAHQEDLNTTNSKVKKLEAELSASEESKYDVEHKYIELEAKYDSDRKRMAELAGQLATFISGSPEEVEKLKAKIKEQTSNPNSPK